MLLNKTEMGMLRWIQGIGLYDHIRSEEMRKRAKVKPIVARVRNGDSVGIDKCGEETIKTSQEWC